MDNHSIYLPIQMYIQNMTHTTTDRARKSESLTKEEQKLFKTWVEKQETKIDAAEILGITRATLDKILATGSGRPDTITKIRSVII